MRTTTDRGRFYEDSQRNRFWSVTTILNGGVPKPLLIPWAAAQASHAMVDELVGPLTATKKLLSDLADDVVQGTVTQETGLRLARAIDGFNHKTVKAADRTVLQQLASETKSVIDKGRSYISSAHSRTRDTAAAAGTEAHDAIEKHILGDDVNVGSLSEMARASFENFIEFEKQLKPRWEATELTVYNATDHYAGTLDFIAEIPQLGEGLTLGDVKTGKGVYPEVTLQLAAYRFAEFVETAHNNARFDMPETNETAVVLHLRPEKWELIPVRCDQQAYDLFRHVSQIAWFTRDGNGDSFLGDIEFSGEREVE